MGRMEPGESFAVVPIPEKIITEKVFSLELVSIAFCNRNEHAASHFPVVQRSAFPEQPPYEEFIDVRRPRPLPVIHRRRTMYIERAPRHAMDEEFESGGRFKRSDDADRAAAVVAAEGGGGVDDYDLKYTAFFNKTSLEMPIADLHSLTLNSFADKFNTSFANRIGPFFLNLYTSSVTPHLDFLPKSETSRTTGRFRLLLPPECRVGVTDPKFWLCLGFPASVITHSKNKIFFVTNSTNSPLSLTTDTDRNVQKKLVLLYTDLYGARSSPDSNFKVSFHDLHSMVRSTLTVDPESLCNKNIIGSCYFFKFLFGSIQKAFTLREDFVNVTYNADNSTIDVTRNVNLPPPIDTRINHIYISMLFGAGLQAKLNLVAPNVTLHIGGKSDAVQLQPPSASAMADDEDDGTCQNKILSLQDDFYNQHSNNDVLRAMAAEWPAKLQARHRAKQAEEEQRQRLETNQLRPPSQAEDEDEESRKRLRPSESEEEVESEKSKKRKKQQEDEEKERLKQGIAEEKRQQDEQKRLRAEAKRKLEEERQRKQQQEEAAEQERLRLEAEQERAEQERIRLATEARIRQEQEEADRLERERIKAEKREQERLRKEQEEADQRKEQERVRKEKAEADRKAAEKKEQERVRKEKAEAERKEIERKEQERLRKAEANRREQERLKKEQEQAEAHRKEQERLRLEKEAERKKQEQEAEQLRQQKERERLRQQQEDEKLRQQQEQLKQQQEQMRKAKEAEDARRAQEAEAARQEQARIQREKDQAKKAQDAENLRQQQERERVRQQKVAEEQRLQQERIRQEQDRLRQERENERLRQEQENERLRQAEAAEQQRQQEENERIRLAEAAEAARLEQEQQQQLQQQQQPPPPPPPPPPLIVIHEAEEEEEEEEEEEDPPPQDDFEIVQIRNPDPRPDNTFVVWNRNPHAVCGPVIEFPPVCTILLREGEPKDYIADKGYCCILGVMRESEPKTVSNMCVVKNNYIRQFTLQFLSNSLTLFTLPEDSQPAWIKLDVICKPYM